MQTIHRQAACRLTPRQRVAVVGMIGIALSILLSWWAWFVSVRDATPIVDVLTFSLIASSLLSVNLAFFWTYGIKFFIPWLAPIPVSRRVASLLVVLWIVTVLISLLIGLWVYSHDLVDVSLEGVATVLPDGRFAIVNHGKLVRYLNPDEYRRVAASEALGTVTVALTLLLVFAALIGVKLWRREAPGSKGHSRTY